MEKIQANVRSRLYPFAYTFVFSLMLFGFPAFGCISSLFGFIFRFFYGFWNIFTILLILWYGGSASSFQVQETPQSRYLLPSTQRIFTHSTVAKNHFTWTPKTALRKHMNPCAKSTVGNASGTLRERFFFGIPWAKSNFLAAFLNCTKWPVGNV